MNATILPILLLSACFSRGDKADDTADSAPPEPEPPQADMLFVIDNSPSMFDESSALGLAFDAFLTALGDVRGLQLAITTTSADPRGSVEPGEMGTLVSGGVMAAESAEELGDAFREALLCHTVCWPGACQGSSTTGCIPSDPSYTCGDDPGGQITWEYLACVCGGSWEPPECGAGTEEGLEAALLALCRAQSEPSVACLGHDGSPLVEADIGSNPGLLRSGVGTEVVVLSDEGDGSRALAQGEDDPQIYLDLFEQVDDPTFIVIGPGYDPDDHSFECNSGGATSWGSARYITTTERTGGFYRHIENDDGDGCAVSDFGDHLVRMAEHLGG